jgi:hypothetical protein
LISVTKTEVMLQTKLDLPHSDVRRCPPHAWDCPVLTKLDPLAIAWTCSACGAIVNAPVGAPRPM